MQTVAQVCITNIDPNLLSKWAMSFRNDLFFSVSLDCIWKHDFTSSKPCNVVRCADEALMIWYHFYIHMCHIVFIFIYAILYCQAWLPNKCGPPYNTRNVKSKFIPKLMGHRMIVGIWTKKSNAYKLTVTYNIFFQQSSRYVEDIKTWRGILACAIGTCRQRFHV